MNPELLLDIAKLLRKYSPGEWEEFLRALREPEFRDRLVYASKELTKLSYQARANSPRSNARSDDEIAFRRAVLLDRIRTDLARRRISDIREYAQSLGTPSDASTSKQALIGRILRTLASRDIEQLERTGTPRLFGGGLTDDYERWGRLIMGKKTKPRH